MGNNKKIEVWIPRWEASFDGYFGGWIAVKAPLEDAIPSFVNRVIVYDKSDFPPLDADCPILLFIEKYDDNIIASGIENVAERSGKEVIHADKLDALRYGDLAILTKHKLIVFPVTTSNRWVRGKCA